MPDNVSDLAKIRYFYMKLGNLFCYDFKIIIDEDLALISVNYDEIGKYQTFTQIAEILNVILNNINKNSKGKIITRNNNGKHRYSHVANEVMFRDEVTGEEYKLLLDLTLDLFRIQAGMETKQFAYTTDMMGSYDIISSRECEKMDRELGLIDDFGYRDKKIKTIKEEIDKKNFSLIEKINYMWKELSLSFIGPHEIRQYFISLISVIFPYLSYDVYNLYYGDVTKSQFASLFILHGEDDIYLLLDNSLGMIVSDKENIKSMFNFGWKTSSKSLLDVIGYKTSNDKVR